MAGCAITPMWYSAITSGVDRDLPLSGKIAGLSSYHYGEMVKRLNDVDKGKGNGYIGYFLRRLWEKLEGRLSVLEPNAYNQWHERDKDDPLKANPKPLSKKTEIGFYADSKGNLGAHTDFLYDTYGKKWSRAYQLTFYCFFRQMDYLANPGHGGFSCSYEDYNFSFANGPAKKYQFWEVIRKDIEILFGDKKNIDSIHALSDYDKAPLYDIIGEALDNNCLSNVPSYVDRKKFSHGHGYWMAKKEPSSAFSQHLSAGVFAHIASAAVVNNKALKAMEAHLPNSRKMFKEILECMQLGLGKYEANRPSGGGSGNKYDPPPPLTEVHPFNYREFFKGKLVMNQGFSAETKIAISSGEGIASTYEFVRNRFVIPMIKHHLFIAEAANGNDKEYYEFTYVYPHFYNDNKVEVYQGFCKATGKHTMGNDFGQLLYNWKEERELTENPKKPIKPKSIKPDIVIHLHPLRADDRQKLEVTPRRPIGWKTMFSENDEKHIESSYTSLWIGIEPFFKGHKSYYIDTYVSIGSWGREGTLRKIPAQHMERIEGLTSKKYGNEIDIIKMKV